MAKKMMQTLAFTLLLIALLMLPASAKMTQQEGEAGSRSNLIDQFGMPAQHELTRDRVLTGADFWPRGQDGRSRRPRLGAAMSAGTGIGEIVDNTYYDWQWSQNRNRFAQHSLEDGLVDVHFLYSEFTDLAGREDTMLWASPRKTGYNVWNANDSTWPWG
ncbi:MAG: hypothetical protein ACYS21_12370, partial [Planctomycetota bacterium]